MRENNFFYLGQCVRDARKRCGLTQQDLADRSGMGLRHIQNIEYGLVNPSYECLDALIKSLGVSANLLFHPDMSEQDIELERFIGKYLSCTEEERRILLHTAEFMADQFMERHTEQPTSEEPEKSW